MWLIATPLLVPILFFMARKVWSPLLPVPVPTPTPVPAKVVIVPAPSMAPTPTPEPPSIITLSLPADATLKLEGLENWPNGQKKFHFLVLKFSPKGKWVAGTLAKGVLGLWDIKTGKLKSKISFAGIFEWSPMAFSPDETKLVMAQRGGYIVFDLRKAVLAPHIFKVSTAKFGDWFTQVSFSPDGKILAIARQNNDVDVISLKTGRLISHLELSKVGGGAIDENTITTSPCVAFSSDGRMMATGGRDGAIALWNVKTSAFIKILGKHKGAVWDVKFSPDGKWLISGGEDKMQVWDMKKYGVRYSFGGNCFHVAFSPDNCHAAGLGSGSLRLYDVLAGKNLHILSANHFAGTPDVKFAPDGKSVLCSGSYILPIRWDITSILKEKH